MNLNYELLPLYSDSQAFTLYRQLQTEIVYPARTSVRVQIYGKWIPMPRDVTAYGDPGLHYTFSQVTFQAKPWIPVLMAIRHKVERLAGATFNFVLINRYRNGQDCIGKHRDNEVELIPNGVIASVSLGHSRRFLFSRPGYKNVPVQLTNGSLLIMRPPTNEYWYHSLPRSSTVHLPRINLTFRQMKPPDKERIKEFNLSSNEIPKSGEK